MPIGSLSIHISDDSAGLAMLATLPVGPRNFVAVAPVPDSQPGDQNSTADSIALTNLGDGYVGETGSARASKADPVPEARSLVLTALAQLPKADLAATVAPLARQYEAIDALMAQNPSEHARHTEKTGVPLLPDAEKTDITLRAEALAAIALSFARAPLKKRTNPDDAQRWRSRHLINY